MRIATILLFAIALSTLTGEAQAAPPPQAIPGCGPVADCVKKLAELVSQLSQENQEQAKRLAILEHAAPPQQTIPGCGSAADCVKKLGELVSQLSQENQEQAKRLATLEHDVAAGRDAIKQLHDRRTALVSHGNDRIFTQGMFWPGDGPTHVNYTCPDHNVLVGMEFEMTSDGVARHPSSIKFICRELSP
jgi:hypothetical protein